MGRSWATCTRGIEGCICGMDDPHRVAMVLEQHNYWRRDGEGKMIDPQAIGLALDAAVVMLREQAKDLDHDH
jgi:protein involved in sex pheromone biosynthesis